MTTMTTGLGLMPLVLYHGAGSEVYRGLGSVVLGGLLVSTVFTLVLVPTLFSLMLDLKASLVSFLYGKMEAEGSSGVVAPVLGTSDSAVATMGANESDVVASGTKAN